MLGCLVVEITFVSEVLGRSFDVIGRLEENAGVWQLKLELGIQVMVDDFQQRVFALVTPDAEEVVHVKRPQHGTAQAQVHNVLDFDLEASYVIETDPLDRSVRIDEFA